MGGAFLLDFFWVTFAVTGIDLTPWSDWSHSLVMAAGLVDGLRCHVRQVLSQRRDRGLLIVFSHFWLDLLIQGASLYPTSRTRRPSQSFSRLTLGRCNAY